MYTLYDKNFIDMVNKLIEEQNKEEQPVKKQKEEGIKPIDEWIKSQNFNTTEDIRKIQETQAIPTPKNIMNPPKFMGFLEIR